MLKLTGNRDVCVLGAGVMGLSVALQIRQALPELNVTIVADRFGTETTSDGAAGLWEPYKLDETPANKINVWGQETYDYLQDLYFSEHAAAAGVTTVAAYQLWSEPHDDPPWKDVVPHFRYLAAKELQPFAAAGGCQYALGWCFTTIICEQRIYLPWLLYKVLRSGVTLQHSSIKALSELSGYSLVVNCTGIGAARLFGDTEMYPVRGHVIRVRAPWIKSNYFVDESNYIIPQSDTVVLGGTAQRGDTDLQPREEDRQHIWQGCLRMMPSLAQAKPEREWVGLRPGRKSVRLEYEEIETEAGKLLRVVHNYGHGGGGVTLSWGCAREVVALVQQALS
ncbi:g7282 [Coccomyxa elongata]